MARLGWAPCLLALLLPPGSSGGLVASALEHCVLPPTRHLNYTDGCGAHAKIASQNISWAAQRGEFESMQILLDTPPAGSLRLTIRAGMGRLSALIIFHSRSIA